MDEIQDLYALRPEEFTAARNDLARAAAAAGEKERAAEIKAFRKPTIVAWALNQLARRHRSEIEGLIRAGEEVRSAQRKALSGAGGQGFRPAMEQRRRLVRDLTRRTVEILSEAGRPSQGAEDEIGRTLEAASSDAHAAELLMAGRLNKPITTAAGFESVAALGLVTAGDTEPEELETEEERSKAEAARVAVSNAERQLEKAEAEANRAQIRVQNLETQAADAQRRLAEAREEAERATEEVARAKDRLRRAKRGG